MAQRNEPSFQQMTQRIETFFWIKELNLFFLSKIRLKELNFLSTWLKELNMTQKIELFFLFQFDRKNWKYFLIWLKELNIFLPRNMTQRIELFLKYDSKDRTFFYMTKRTNSFFWHDSKNWTFFWTRLIDLRFFFFSKKKRKIWPSRIEPLFYSVWLKELNPFFLNTIHRIEPFC